MNSEASKIQDHEPLTLFKKSLGFQSLSIQELPGKANRKAIVLHLLAHDENFCICNTHLEWPTNQTATKIKQLKVVNSVLQNCEHSIIAGDFMFYKESEKKLLLQSVPSHQEVWPMVNPSEPGHT